MKFKRNYIIENTINSLILAYEVAIIVSACILFLKVNSYCWIIVGAVFLWPLFDIISALIKTKKNNRTDVILNSTTLIHEGIEINLNEISSISYNPGIYSKAEFQKRRPAELSIQWGNNYKHIIEHPSYKLVKILKNNLKSVPFKLEAKSSLLFSVIAPWVLVLIIFIISLIKK